MPCYKTAGQHVRSSRWRTGSGDGLGAPSQDVGSLYGLVRLKRCDGVLNAMVDKSLYSVQLLRTRDSLVSICPGPCSIAEKDGRNPEDENTPVASGTLDGKK